MSTTSCMLNFVKISRFIHSLLAYFSTGTDSNFRFICYLDCSFSIISLFVHPSVIIYDLVSRRQLKCLHERSARTRFQFSFLFFSRFRATNLNFIDEFRFAFARSHIYTRARTIASFIPTFSRFTHIYRQLKNTQN